MANVLIVYATREGQTRKIARRIADVLCERGHATELVDTDDAPGDLGLARFDAVFVGADAPEEEGPLWQSRAGSRRG